VKQWFYVDRSGAAAGPVTADDVVALLANGTLNSHSSVWTPEFGADWRAIYTTEFQQNLRPPPPPAPKQPPSLRDMQPPPEVVTISASRKFINLIIVIPIALLIKFIGYLIIESFSDTQFFATSAGMSVPECRSTMIQLGARYDDADAKCRSRIPK
jgi:hypothetical protein